MSSTIASPTPTSAAAIVMTNSANTWPGRLVQVGRERDQVDVHRVEHQLDAHEHEHAVAPGEHAVDADAEQDRGEDEELVEDHQSLRAITTAPTSAASRRIETISNGTT